jgi:hypothetical protein
MKEKIKKRVLEAVGMIPEGHRTDPALKEAIRCVLYQLLKEQGLRPVPAFRNPRYPEGPVDIVGMKDDQTVAWAFCSNTTIELQDIKSLDRIVSEKKVVISFSENENKVKMSTFYLKPGIEHINIYGKGEA